MSYRELRKVYLEARNRLVGKTTSLERVVDDLSYTHSLKPVERGWLQKKLYKKRRSIGILGFLKSNAASNLKKEKVKNCFLCGGRVMYDAGLSSSLGTDRPSKAECLNCGLSLNGEHKGDSSVIQKWNSRDGN